jgi:hypothetical protein
MVEKEVRADMGWFFRQWVYGTALPSYTVKWTKDQNERGEWYIDAKVTVEGVDSTFKMLVTVDALSEGNPVDGWVDQVWISGLTDEFRIGSAWEPTGLQFDAGPLARVRIQGP